MTDSSTVADTPSIFDNNALLAGCPGRMALEHVTSKWGLLLLIALSEGDQRWSDLRRRADGISEKMLAQTLRTLEGDGLINRYAHATIPPRVDYSLTSRGLEVCNLLIPLAIWALRNAEAIVSGQQADAR